MTRKSAERAPVVSLLPDPTAVPVRSSKIPPSNRPHHRRACGDRDGGLSAARSLRLTELDMVSGVIGKCT